MLSKFEKCKLPTDKFLQYVYWIAGIVDGEGWIGLGSNRVHPMIQVAMTDKDTVEKLNSLWNGTLVTARQYHVGYKTQYRSTVNGINAIGWMLTLYPLMSLRRRERIKQTVQSWRSTKSIYSRSVGDRCTNGHLLTKDNIYVTATDYIICKICRRRSMRKYLAKNA